MRDVRPIHVLLLLGALAAIVAVVACASGGDAPVDLGDGGGDEGGIGSGDGGSGGDGGDATTKTGDGGCGAACNCSAMGPPSSCAAAMSLGTLSVGQTASATGNLVTTTAEAYVSVSFTDNVNLAYHPTIALTQGASEFAFDVISDCSGSFLECADDEAGSSATTWEEFYADASDADPDVFVPIMPAGDDGGVIIRIHRQSGKSASCNTYQLTISE
jgi:hypothetical protein